MTAGETANFNRGSSNLTQKHLVRLILPEWASDGAKRRVVEGEFTKDQLDTYNAEGYNVYYLPNPPSDYKPGTTVEGAHIDTFRCVFLDMDLKDGRYPSKDAFIDAIAQFPLAPTSIVDSGNGVHVYWAVSDLDAMSYLRLCRRLMRKFETDEAVGQIFQLMRLPDSLNTKNPEDFKMCAALYESDCTYTCEELDKHLPAISQADEAHCKQHFEKTYRLKGEIRIDTQIPLKFTQLIDKSREAKDIWLGNTDDRSKSDYRLAHIMLASGFTREEALAVLSNSSKALPRAPAHRVTYAQNIIDKTFPAAPPPGTPLKELSQSVASLLSTGDDETLKGDRIYGAKFFDNTHHGFRLGHVLGLVAGVGVGKTTISLNLFKSFIELNPQWHHMFVSLEQPASEIAARLKKMFGNNTSSYDKIHIISNENADGSKRDLSLHDIQTYILDFQKRKNIKIACVVLDHIGILRMVTSKGENQGLMDVCRDLKGFARATNTLFIVQSQSSREKAGDGDLELFKGAAYGTQHFESYMDFLMVAWAPLKRCYDDPVCPTVTAYKFVKIRFKTIGKDKIIEDQPYRLYFNGDKELLQDMTQEQERSFDFFAGKCLTIRNKDKKSDLVAYKSVRWEEEGSTSDNRPESVQKSHKADM